MTKQGAANQPRRTARCGPRKRHRAGFRRSDARQGRHWPARHCELAYAGNGRAAHSSGIFSDGYGAIFLEGDLRYLSQAQFDSARAKMQLIVAEHLPRTDARLTVENEYPSMTPTEGNYRVLSVYDSVSRGLGAEAVVGQDPIERGRYRLRLH